MVNMQAFRTPLPRWCCSRYHDYVIRIVRSRSNEIGRIARASPKRSSWEEISRGLYQRAGSEALQLCRGTLFSQIRSTLLGSWDAGAVAISVLLDLPYQPATHEVVADLDLRSSRGEEARGGFPAPAPRYRSYPQHGVWFAQPLPTLFLQHVNKSIGVTSLW
ncbi:hypothetical protein BU23DRAFT_73973 [Bimuria novae-zelandiae CBS 107.79]|uniref:Uncharacterized protein n=1 Tax=Bimuria novae-zelandiae CBS 107.79 TaxID=1447943 RepID=A0A6A5VFF0_9PLEO|nr:hypothetical protein BU23DRAFT_73973 [Bimuria novae-zelandiae CBS 107.79]